MTKSTGSLDFESAQTLMRNLGIEILEARSTPEAFGSWFVRGSALGKAVRVVWDGRDAVLLIQAPRLNALSNDWDDHWIAGEHYSQKPTELRNGLLALLGR